MANYEVSKFLTVKIETANEKGTGAGTGFFMRTKINNKIQLVIVTVRHVIDDADEIYFNLHYMPNINEKPGAIKISHKPKWYTMGDKELCCCEIDELNEKMRKMVNSEIYCNPVSENNILKETEIDQLSIMNEIVMIGYPAGVSSTPMNYPLLRRGYLASAPEDNYANDGGYVDIEAVGGSSGSPIFIKGENAKLIGVINKTVMDNPFSSANIGIYIDAYKLLEINEEEE